MRCSKAQTLIINQIAGELAAHKRIALQQHLDACPSCRAYHQAQTDLDKMLFSAPATAFPLQIHKQIMDQVNARSSRKAPLPLLVIRKVPVAAAIIFSLYIGSLVGIKTYQSQETSATSLVETQDSNTELASFGENSIWEDYAYGVSNE